MPYFDLDPLLESMLDAAPGISDLNLSVGRPPQVEIDGQLRPVAFAGIERLAPFQTELVAMRLIANKPRVLLLDEPTANLDQANMARVEDLLNQWRITHNPVMIWVGHDPDQLARCCDSIVRLENGRIGPLPAEGRPGGPAAEMGATV